MANHALNGCMVLKLRATLAQLLLHLLVDQLHAIIKLNHAVSDSLVTPVLI